MLVHRRVIRVNMYLHNDCVRVYLNVARDVSYLQTQYIYYDIRRTIYRLRLPRCVRPVSDEYTFIRGELSVVGKIAWMAMKLQCKIAPPVSRFREFTRSAGIFARFSLEITSCRSPHPPPKGVTSPDYNLDCAIARGD